jgi:hypothetical protein
MDDELRAFKTEIDLRDYAYSVGYKKDDRKSTQHKTYMRRGPDKINVHREANGEWTFYSFHDGLKGSIIDFVQKRQSITNLGCVRQTLRPWIGRDPSPRLPPPPKSAPQPNGDAVRAKCAGMAIARRHPYLERDRAIPGHILESPRFAGTVRINGYGDGIFPHSGADGNVSGWEARGKVFKGFSKGGVKTLWRSQKQAQDNTLVFTESGINSLSYAALYPNPRARFASIAGNASSLQHQLIRQAMDDMPAGSRIVAAMDADDNGHKHAATMREILNSLNRADLVFREHYPETEDTDWNDLLRLRAAA